MREGKRKKLEANRDELPGAARLIKAVRCSIMDLREARARWATIYADQVQGKNN